MVTICRKVAVVRVVERYAPIGLVALGVCVCRSIQKPEHFYSLLVCQHGAVDEGGSGLIDRRDTVFSAVLKIKFARGHISKERTACSPSHELSGVELHAFQRWARYVHGPRLLEMRIAPLVDINALCVRQDKSRRAHTPKHEDLPSVLLRCRHRQTKLIALIHHARGNL